MLSPLQRRVLGHLPVWTDDEDAFQRAELEAGAAESIRSYTVAELYARLTSDPHMPALTEAQLLSGLKVFEGEGLASCSDGAWSMTEGGLIALTKED